MKRNWKWKMTAGLLAASFAGMVLSGCAAGEKDADTQVSEPTVYEVGTNEPVTDESAPEQPAENEAAANETAADSGAQTGAVDAQTPVTDGQSLYEQFLNNAVSVTVSSDYPEVDYVAPIFERGSSYTLAEMGECISGYFLNPEYMDKTSYDYIQYAYVDCPDRADKQNLLIKFVGLNIYSQGDDSYAVFVITEDNGQLYVTDEYQCWARSAATAYANGMLRSYGSGGAGDHYDGQSVILSNGRNTTIYSAELLEGWWTSYVNDAIYNEIFSENTEINFVVSIYSIDGEKYYQYDMSRCPEEEKEQCETYINRCRDEEGINWITDEEVKALVEKRCSALGVDYGITQQSDEAVWNNL